MTMPLDIYAELGVRKVVNAAGTYTMVGGARMSERTLDAMKEAARSHVVIKELQAKVHERLALLTKNEAAFVTNGAACGLHIAGAAAVARYYGRPHASLSSEQIAKCEIIIHRAHRNPYDWAVKLLGTKLVEIGFPNMILPTTSEDLELAVTEDTVAIYYFFMQPGGWMPQGALSFEKTLEVAKRHGIPVIVDAAAQLPPVDNLWRITEQGASVCLFSGGKDLCGPQASGLAVGKKDFMEWMEKTAFPTYGVGRMFKVGREEIVGLLSAVEEYVSMDHDARNAWCEEQIVKMRNAFGGSGIIEVERVFPNEAGQPIPQMIVRFKPPESKKLSEDVSAFVLRRLRDGNPSIFTMAADGSGVFVNPVTLREGETELIAARIGEIEEELKRA